MLDLAPPPLEFVRPELRLPRPALVRLAEPWEIRLASDLERRGVTSSVRVAVIAEVKRLAGIRAAYLEGNPFRESGQWADTPLIALGAGGAAVLAATASSLTTLTFVTSTDSSASTITLSASAAVGDLVVLFDRATNSSGDPTDVTPSGWSSPTDGMNVGNSRRIRISYKIVAGGEPGGTVTGMNGTGSNVKLMFVFHGNIPITTVTPGTFQNSGVTDGNPASQTVSVAGHAPPLVILGLASVGGANAGAFNASTTAFDAQISATVDNIRAGYKINNAGSTPANHTVDQDDLGSNNYLASGLLRAA